MTYELLEHTADVAIRVRGRDLPELLAEVAHAVVDLMADAKSVERKESRAIALAAANCEELVVAFANELLFLCETERLLLPWVDIETASPTQVRAVAHGERIDPARHGWKGELKSATYHDLAVHSDPKGENWSVDLVLDV